MNFSDFSLKRKKLIIILAVLCASFSAILVRFADAPSLVLVFYRNLLAAAVLTLPCLRQIRAEYTNFGKKEICACLVSGFFLALHFTAYFESLRYTNISSSVVLVDMEVFFVAFIMLLFFRERISKRGWIGILLTFVGSIIIAAGDAGEGSNILLGDAYAISGALFMAIYTIMGKICRRTMSTTVYTTIVYWMASLSVMIILLVQGVPIIGWEMKDVLISFGMTILCTLLGHSVYSWGLKFIEPSFISTVKLMEPLFASILGIFFFMELPSLTAVVGGILIISGIVYYMRVSN